MHRTADIRTIQALRAVACALVVIYHAAGGPRAWPNGAAGVDLFFVISGYVMLRSSTNLVGRPFAWRRFLRRRVRRIVPLYWLLTGAKAAFATLRPALAPQTHIGAWNLAASLLFIPVADASGTLRPVLPVGWSLDFECLFYVSFAAALAAGLPPLRLTPLLCLLAVAGFWRVPSWPAPFLLANGMVLEFAAGMALAHASHALRPRTASCLLAIATIALITLPQAGPWRGLVWGLPAAAMLAASVSLEPSLGPRLPAWLLAMGDASYAIYLVHPFVVPPLARYGAIGAALAVPASIAAGLLVHRFVDAPLQRRLAGPRRPPPAYAEAEAGAGVLSL